jgi:hypothetical protein
MASFFNARLMMHLTLYIKGQNMEKPKILIFDVETKPVKAWLWRTGKQVVRHEQIVDGEKFDIICIGYKWLGEAKVECLDWGRAQNSARMIEKFTKVIEKADVVIGQNSDPFDIKQINMQRLLHRQKPIAWPISEDLRKQIKKHFYVTSSSLEYLAKLLTGEGKGKVTFQDWVAIVDRRSAVALAKMKHYGKRDVLKTEQVWERIQPYITPRVNQSLVINGHKKGCKSCGSLKVKKDGIQYQATKHVQRWRCLSCHHLWRV